MPSNFAVQAEQQLNLRLITMMPHKVKQIITDILLGKKNITHPKLQDRFFASIGRAEHFGARIFGASISSSKDCNQCGLCMRNCPKKNIRMLNGSPKFGFDCMWCLKCIYACPRNALSPRILKNAVLKNSFDLKTMSEMAQQNEHEIECKSSRSILRQGVIDYLMK
jgi:ferredoxin